MNPLSNAEQTLYDFIKTSPESVTVELITTKLSKSHTGALGKLLYLNLIEKKSKRPDNLGYGSKFIKYYAINPNSPRNIGHIRQNKPLH